MEEKREREMNKGQRIGNYTCKRVMLK